MDFKDVWARVPGRRIPGCGGLWHRSPAPYNIICSKNRSLEASIWQAKFDELAGFDQDWND